MWIADVASLLIQQGENLAYVKEQMGHSSIQVTVDVYGHLVPGGIRAVVDRLDDAQPSATPAQPAAVAVGQREPVSRSARMVSRGGIEPPTRRLRGSRESKLIKADPEQSQQIGVGRSCARLLVVNSSRVVRNPLHNVAHRLARFAAMSTGSNSRRLFPGAALGDD